MTVKRQAQENDTDDKDLPTASNSLVFILQFKWPRTKSAINYANIFKLFWFKLMRERRRYDYIQLESVAAKFPKDKLYPLPRDFLWEIYQKSPQWRFKPLKFKAFSL